MIWIVAGIWLAGTIAYFFLVGWLNPRAHGVGILMVACLWPIAAPVQLVIALTSRRRPGNPPEPPARLGGPPRRRA
jgi:hypothetical protein